MKVKLMVDLGFVNLIKTSDQWMVMGHGSWVIHLFTLVFLVGDIDMWTMKVKSPSDLDWKVVSPFLNESSKLLPIEYGKFDIKGSSVSLSLSLSI